MFAADRVLTGDFLSLNLDQLRQQISNNYLIDENRYLQRLLPLAQLEPAAEARARQRTLRWIHALRRDDEGMGIDPLLQEYRLDTQEGLVLMSVAEALLRIPDSDTANRFIEDRLLQADWQSHLHTDNPIWLNTSTWALAKARDLTANEGRSLLTKITKRLGAPLLRQALREAMAVMGNRYILGETLFEALDKGQSVFNRGDSCSFDMLGEAALCRQDSDAYYQAYLHAINTLGANESYPDNCVRPSISIKLSALHPRFEANQEHCIVELEASVSSLIERARSADIAITIDAEEMDRLEPTLNLFQRLYQNAAKDWGQLGLAVQAYSKRALPVICWLTRLAKQQGDRIPVRLVKGAYWDSEIKLAQQKGLSDYPVFSRKAATDLSYLACCRVLFSGITRGHLHPQLASHNAHSLSQILELADDRPFEFQRLKGMGEALYRQVRIDAPHPCRIYAPVGEHRHLLPYLVRRLLENGANSSFVNQLQNPAISPESLCQPAEVILAQQPISLPLPSQLFAPTRTNSRGLNLQVESHRNALQSAISDYEQRVYTAAPLIAGESFLDSDSLKLFSPFDSNRRLGDLYSTSVDQADLAVSSTTGFQDQWEATPISTRADIIERWAERIEQQGSELIHLLCYEAGKTLTDAIDELREAVDFCRYYASQARSQLEAPHSLPAITGEQNQLCFEPRGLFVCISPWNFPLAIFSGQIAAALVTGNVVIAKPARQCGLIAYRCCQLLLEAGLPDKALALLPGASSTFSDQLLQNPKVSGVAFTGSTESARQINIRLAQRPQGPITTLIAETGGQNAMLVDSTALPEQVVKDVLLSAFGSAGQRCSALRVLYLQEEIADEVERLLIGAMDELVIGPPDRLQTDIGPVIDREAKTTLYDHIAQAKRSGRLIHQTAIPSGLTGSFVAPTLVSIGGISELTQEHFGPILHRVRYQADQIGRIIDDINGCGYGLTLGLQSRNQHWLENLASRLRVGNIYINRNQIGAVVGCQPFGGMGLSGTGPKAGGPHYLQRFMTEKVVTTNTTAWGGNVALLNQSDSIE